jgi:hypothetical protein
VEENPKDAKLWKSTEGTASKEDLMIVLAASGN